MALFITANNGKIAHGIKKYLCDTIDDLPLEVQGESIKPGSEAYIADSKKTYKYTSAGQWAEINAGGGGASAIEDLEDVNIEEPTDGQVLKYDEETGTWVNGDDEGIASLEGLTDVNLDSVTNGQVLKYDATTEKWINATDENVTSLAGLTDVNLTQLANGQTLVYDLTTGKWVNIKITPDWEASAAELGYIANKPAIPDVLSDLSDVNASAATDGQLLVFDQATGTWKNGAGKSVYADITGTLAAGSTSITLQSAYITSNSVVEVFIDSAFEGVTYDELTLTTGSVTLLFAEQSTAMPVMVRVWIDGIGAANAEINDLTPSPNTTYSGDKIEDELDKKPDSNDIAPDYNNTQTYKPGDVVVYNNNYYITNQTITIPEDFDPTKWTETTIVEIIESKAGSATLAGLSDTTITTPTNKQLLSYDGTSGKWINITYVEGSNNTITGANAHAEGSNNTAAGANSHVEGTGSGTSAAGAQAHAEGSATHANATGAHSEGNGTTASGIGSHAEGGGTVASGDQSHAEGGGSQATGAQSHAEGGGSVASAQNSHAEGTGTIAASEAQHVVGKYNIEDNQDEYAEIVGNGNLPSGASQPTRSNARTLDWQGNETLAGDLIINGNTSVGQALQGIPDELSDLDDVVITSPTDMQGLVYDANTGKWKNGNVGSGGASTAADVSYVNTTSSLSATNVQDAIDEVNNKANGARQAFIQVYTSDSTATIMDYNTFEEFKAAVTTKTILFDFHGVTWHSVTSAPSGTMQVYNYFYYVGKETTDYYYGSDSGTTEGLVFIGMLNGVDTKVTSPTAPHMTNKLVKIVFEDSLVGTITELETGHDYIEVTGTLTAGSTSVTLQNAAIHTTSTIDIYTGVYTIMPTDAQTTEGQIVLTFDEQSSNLSVKVKVWN